MVKITSEIRDELRQWIAEAVEDLKFGNWVEFDVRDDDGVFLTARQISRLLPDNIRYRAFTTRNGAVAIARR